MKHVEEQESGRSTRDVEPPPENPRLRFAKRELMKLIGALETADNTELTAWMRVLDLEEQLSDTREEVRRLMRCQQDLLALIDCTGSNLDLDRLGQIMREWVGKA